MTGFDEYDDFDDDETVVHQSARPQVPGSDELNGFDDDGFDDDETFLSAPTVQAGPAVQAGPTVQAGPAVQTQPRPIPGHGPPPAPTTAGPGSGPSADPGPDGVRSLGALQDQAPLGPGWRPPARPTAYHPAPYDGPTRSRFGRLHLVALVLALAVAGGALAVGMWWVLTEPGAVGP